MIDTEKILNELRDIARKLCSLSKEKDLNTYRETLLQLNSLKARLNYMLPEIQYLYDSNLQKVTETIAKTYEDKLKGNSSLIKNLIQGLMKGEQRLINIFERNNSTIEHISKNLITIISSIKAEMQGVS